MADVDQEEEIVEFDVAIIEDQQIFWFQIAVDDILIVKILQSKNDTSENKANSWLSCQEEGSITMAFFVDESEDISFLGPFHHDIVG
jgi:hypothetical protein